jgi:drug/metabolite transporter (DMT)-like permease
MGSVLAVLTACLYGSGDFLGGIASRRNSALQVLFASQTIGALGLFVALPFFQPLFRWSDIAIGAAAGACGLVGLGLFYRCLAKGPMSVVASISALTAAIVPISWDLILGNVPSVKVFLGMGLGLAAIVLVSMRSSEGETKTLISSVAGALAAGLGFGMFFSILSYVGSDSAPWPIVSGRLTAVLILVVVSTIRSNEMIPKKSLPIVAGCAACDTGANLTLLLALGQDSLAPVALLSSLYPVTTIVLARLFLGEDLYPRRVIGLVVALSSVLLIATA